MKFRLSSFNFFGTLFAVSVVAFLVAIFMAAGYRDAHGVQSEELVKFFQISLGSSILTGFAFAASKRSNN